MTRKMETVQYVACLFQLDWLGSAHGLQKQRHLDRLRLALLSCLLDFLKNGRLEL
jgi:hypothetical protein